MSMKEQQSIYNFGRQLQHQVESKTANTSFQNNKRIPRQLYSSRTGILKWIGEQKEQHQLKGIRCFWIFLLTYMQVEHYDIAFTKLQQKIKQTKRQLLIRENDNDNQQQQQQKSQISSISSSSVNIRQRKVSFGIIKPNNISTNMNKKNDSVQTKRRRNINKNNLFIVVGNNSSNNNIDNDYKMMSDQQLKRLNQRQMRLKSLLRKVKVLVYSYLQKVNGQQKHSQKQSKQSTQKQRQESTQKQRQVSILVAKALSILFTSQQTKLKDIFQYQNTQPNLIVQILSHSNRDQNQNIQQRISIATTTRYLINTLINTLEQATMQNILVNSNSNNTQYRYQQSNCPINNIVRLLQHFNFNSGQDYHLIHQQQHLSSTGINILKGFFTILANTNNDGYLIFIVVDKLYDSIDGIDSTGNKSKKMLVNDKVKNVIKQSLSLNSLNTQQKLITKQVMPHVGDNNKHQQQQRQLRQQQNETNLSYKIDINSNNLNYDLNSNNLNYITTTTPTQFINRYNNRYFRNQRLLYKQQQRHKLQNRFRQQQYNQINDNNTSNNNNDDGFKFSHQQQQDRNNNERQYNGYKILVTKDNLISAQHGNINIYNQQQYQQQNQYKHQQSQLQVQDEINNLFDNDYQYQSQEQQSNHQKYQQQIKQQHYQQQIKQQHQHQPQQQLLNHFYSRNDFEISDNQILDDIQRVLLI